MKASERRRRRRGGRRVDSVVALRNFVEASRDLNEIRPILPQLLDELFRLMNEVENEDLVFTLETIVEKFGEEIAPFALGLCQVRHAPAWVLSRGELPQGRLRVFTL